MIDIDKRKALLSYGKTKDDRCLLADNCVKINWKKDPIMAGLVCSEQFG
jgi:hypothetical protein